METLPVTILAEECAAELEFYRISENVASAISYCINIFLIYLIVFHTPNDLKVYSRVLLCASVVDILYTTVLLVIGAHVTIKDGMFFFMLNGFIYTSNPSECFLFVCIFLFTFYFTVVFVTVPFVYRYVLICRNCLMSHSQFALLMASSLLSGLAVPVACYFCYFDDMWSMLTSENTKVPLLPCEYPAQIPFFSLKLTWKTATPLLIATGTIAYNYAVIIWCSLKIWDRVNSAKNMSKSAKTMNKQLNYMLLLQASAPIALMALPLTAMFVTVYGGVKHADGLMLIGVATSWIPVLNPLSIIYFVKCYRSRTCSIFFGTKAKNIAITSDDYEAFQKQHTNDVFL
ncbi:serpentine type 7TM GPCR chemoreceptor str domain-containing protein [Ditylenchus destructor]|nr:serpentine type 7TM GPCR chemoreceptor str domain-containing protein [Ditylenchus destructor]